MCIHQEINEWLHQHADNIYNNIVEYVMLDVESDMRIHESSVAFFYNLLCVFDKSFTKVY